jgi:hypothetical protein
VVLRAPLTPAVLGVVPAPAATLFLRVILWCWFIAPARIDREAPEGAAPVGTRATTLIPSDARVAISDSKPASRVPGRVRTGDVDGSRFLGESET